MDKPLGDKGVRSTLNLCFAADNMNVICNFKLLDNPLSLQQESMFYILNNPEQENGAK